MMSDNAREVVERLRQAAGRFPSEAEREFLLDLRGFIEFGLSNGLTFSTILGTIGHDVNEIARSGFDLGSAKRSGFLPKVTGYASLATQDAGQTEGQD
jgi:hypothetical protein